MDAGRRGFLQLAALAPIGAPVLAAEVLRAPAAGQLGAPWALKSWAGANIEFIGWADVQAKGMLLDTAPTAHPIGALRGHALSELIAEARDDTAAQAARARIVDHLVAAEPFPGSACPTSLSIASAEARQGDAAAIVPGAAS